MHTSDCGPSTEREIVELNRQYEQVRRSMPTFEVAGAAMRDAVGFYTGYLQGYPTVAQFVVPLSAALEATRPSGSTRSRGRRATTPSDARHHAPALARAAARKGVRARRGQRRCAPLGRKIPTALRRRPLRVRARRSPGDRRPCTISAARSRKWKGSPRTSGASRDIAPTWSKVPLDLRSSLQLQGRNGEREPASMDARFVLRIVRTREAT
jgi:hypothetical protein